MKSRPAQPVNKGECCRRFGWSRYEFDKHVATGMPVIQAASHKGAEWRVDLRAVSRWIEKRKAEEAARRQRVREYYARREAERKAAEKARWEQEQAQERARWEAQKRHEAAWQEFFRRERLHRRLERAYGHCKRMAYLDLVAYCERNGIPGPTGRDWPERFPQYRVDWPMDRPLWWMPHPDMLEAILAEPETIPYGYKEPDWRQWWPGYEPGKQVAWPWRDESYTPPKRPPQYLR
jgi:phage terminase Nu1 subunit (DNA packaging protein)